MFSSALELVLTVAYREATARRHTHLTLEHLLYALALHRYLSRRVAGYTFDRHYGGALYLFVRGVRPQWKTPAGAQAGVHFHRLAAATLGELDALFAAQPAAVR